MSVSIDLVLCLDTTAAMAGCLDAAKTRLRTLTDQLRLQCMYEGIFRVKLICIRDYQLDGEMAVQVTDFLTLPRETENYDELMGEITLSERSVSANALEGLAYAIRSEWAQAVPTAQKRQVIVLLSAGHPHMLGHGQESIWYDSQLPRFFSRLTRWWNNDAYIDQNAKRLILAAPMEHPWSQISENWDRTLHVTAEDLLASTGSFADFILGNV